MWCWISGFSPHRCRWVNGASVHRLGCYEDGKVRWGLWCLSSSDGITTGTSLDSSFTSVLMVASAPVVSQHHHNLIFFACCQPLSRVLLLRWSLNSDSSAANIGLTSHQFNIIRVALNRFCSFKSFHLTSALHMQLYRLTLAAISWPKHLN